MTDECCKVGYCKTCGLKLIQTPDRVYHPASILTSDDSCAALIPIDSDYPDLGLSFDVPATQFVFVRGIQHD